MKNRNTGFPSFDRLGDELEHLARKEPDRRSARLRVPIIIGVVIVIGAPLAYAVTHERGQSDPVPVPEDQISRDESSEVDFSVEDIPPDYVLKGCRENETVFTRLHCEALEAIARGDLKPGSYEDEQLKEELQDG